MSSPSPTTIRAGQIHQALDRLATTRSAKAARSALEVATLLLQELPTVLNDEMLEDFARRIRDQAPRLREFELEVPVRRFAEALIQQTLRTRQASRRLMARILQRVLQASQSSADQRWSAITGLTDLLVAHETLLPTELLTAIVDGVSKMIRDESSNMVLAALLELRDETEELLETHFELVDPTGEG